jgi:hypothetical protein
MMLPMTRKSLLLCALLMASAAPILAQPAKIAAKIPGLLDDYCSRCHNDIDRAGQFSLDSLSPADLAKGAHAAQWEALLRKVQTGEMPPRAKAQPSPQDRAAMVAWVAAARSAYARAHPDPGHIGLRRLNRVEYAHALRDILGLDVDVSRELPQDNSGYGFDNIADVLSVSPTLMERYVAVAGKVARMATGLGTPRPAMTTYDVPKDGSIANGGRPAYNERASDLLPLGSRGGGAFTYFARGAGAYDLSGWLNANTNNETDRLPENRVKTRVQLSAGSHVIAMTFRRQLAPDATIQTLRNDLDKVPMPTAAPVMLPLDVWIDGRRVQSLMVPSYRLSDRYAQQNYPRDLIEIDVEGPFDPRPTAAKIFVCHPQTAAQQAPCAQTILSNLARKAYRRPITPADMAPLMRVYAREVAAQGFEQAVEAGIEAILVSPHFLFQPDGASDQALATRLALFLWSSVPDDTLLALASANRLHQPAILNAQITRMLADPRSAALTQNFAGQWLYLRNLDQQRPDITLFPQFDTRLRAAMARETELFFDHILHTNASLLDFLNSDYTFLNQRLAQHYGIPGISGPAFRKVALDPAWHRGGLLGQASILTVTSYGNHTSVVKRGKWVLENLLASPPPPPPPHVPALKETHDGKLLSARAQLELHRKDPACASCHVRMDPIGFALENYDAIGGFRKTDAGDPIDAAATMPDGTNFSGLSGLRGVLLAQQDQFAQAFTEKLMTYALGRGIIPADRPQIRAIAAKAAANHYRIQTVIRGIVQSDAFLQRRAPQEARP